MSCVFSQEGARQAAKVIECSLKRANQGCCVNGRLTSCSQYKSVKGKSVFVLIVLRKPHSAASIIFPATKQKMSCSLKDLPQRTLTLLRSFTGLYLVSFAIRPNQFRFHPI